MKCARLGYRDASAGSSILARTRAVAGSISRFASLIAGFPLPHELWSVRPGPSYGGRHSLVDGAKRQRSRRLLSCSQSVAILMMLIYRVGIVPEPNSRPAAGSEHLEHDRILQRWRRLATAVPNANLGLNVDEGFSLHELPRARRPPSRTMTSAPDDETAYMLSQELAPTSPTFRETAPNPCSTIGPVRARTWGLRISRVGDPFRDRFQKAPLPSGATRTQESAASRERLKLTAGTS